MSTPHMPPPDEPMPPAPTAPHAPPPAPPAPRPAARPRKRGGLFGIVAVVLVLCGIGLVLFVLFIALALSGGESVIGTSGAFKEETVIQGASGENRKIAVISLSGPISGDGSHVTGSDMVYDLTQQLRCAGRDKDVKAVLLQVDSPGGGLTASDLIYSEVKRLRERKGKPIVVWVGDLAASGGYYVSAPADHITACPTSLIGSIGVIMMRFMVRDLMEQRLGIKYDPIMAGDAKDIGSIFREMKPEERSSFQRLLTHFHERFITVVSEGRKLPKEAVRALADGHIYTPEEAKAKGLIDEIGYFDAALARAKSLAGVKAPMVVRYKKKSSWTQFLEARMNVAQGPRVRELFRLLHQAATPQVRAQWVGAP